MKAFYLVISFLVIMTNIDKSFSEQRIFSLPLPKRDGRISLEKVLDERRSIREYSNLSLKLEEVSQLVWAAYGKNKWQKLTAPSAGALYPLVIYVLIGNVDNLPVGFYRYDNRTHSLFLISPKDIRKELYYASLNQSCIVEAAMVIVICADYSITTSTYGARGKRYVDIEVGHVGQNIYLEATALNLGTVAIGAFRDEEVKKILKIKEEPLYIMPIGKVK